MNDNLDSLETPYTEYQGTYPELVQDVLRYILVQKETNKDLTLIDIIYSFCVKNNYDPEMVGDAVHDDYYLSKLIENDLIASNKENDEW